MSETEHIKCKLVPTGETLEVFMSKLGIDLGEREGLEDTFYCDYYDSHVLIDGNVYAIEERRDFQYDDVFEASKNPDGSINVHLKYYNGCCGFSEAVGHAIDNMEQRNK